MGDQTGGYSFLNVVLIHGMKRLQTPNVYRRLKTRQQLLRGHSSGPLVQSQRLQSTNTRQDFKSSCLFSLWTKTKMGGDGSAGTWRKRDFLLPGLAPDFSSPITYWREGGLLFHSQPFSRKSSCGFTPSARSTQTARKTKPTDWASCISEHA